MPVYWKWVIKSIPGFLWGLLMWASQVTPGQATSNIEAWLTSLGLQNVPSWMVNESIDKWVFTVALVGFVVWAGIMFVNIYKKDTDTKPSEERIFVSDNITPQYLMGLYREEGRTTVQGNALAKPFLGKWMKVSGIMHDVEDETDYKMMSFFLNHNSKRDLCFLVFHGDAFERVLILKRGDTFTAIGQIDEMGNRGFTLDNCELID